MYFNNWSCQQGRQIMETRVAPNFCLWLWYSPNLTSFSELTFMGFVYDVNGNYQFLLGAASTGLRWLLMLTSEVTCALNTITCSRGKQSQEEYCTSNFLESSAYYLLSNDSHCIICTFSRTTILTENWTVQRAIWHQHLYVTVVEQKLKYPLIVVDKLNQFLFALWINGLLYRELLNSWVRLLCLIIQRR